MKNHVACGLRTATKYEYLYEPALTLEKLFDTVLASSVALFTNVYLSLLRVRILREIPGIMFDTKLSIKREFRNF